MSNTIKIKRGESNNLSVNELQDGELAVTLDTNKLYTNKGQISPDNVYVGDTEPTDANIKCWVSPSGKIDLSSLWDQIYPVGSIYITTNTTNPSLLFSGVWEPFAQGRTLIGIDRTDTDFNTIGKTGGEKTHKLTIAEMPSHQHQSSVGNNPTTASNYDHMASAYGGGTPKDLYTTFVGASQPHNNLQPYVTVNMWQRIS